MAAVAVHVIGDDVVSAGDGNAVVLVDDHTVVNRGVVAARESESIAVVRCREAVGSVVWCISSAIV